MYIQWSLTYLDPTYLDYRVFTYPDTCLGPNPHSSTESASLIWKFGYPDGQSGNGVVKISEAQLYLTGAHKKNVLNMQQNKKQFSF